MPAKKPRTLQNCGEDNPGNVFRGSNQAEAEQPTGGAHLSRRPISREHGAACRKRRRRRLLSLAEALAPFLSTQSPRAAVPAGGGSPVPCAQPAPNAATAGLLPSRHSPGGRRAGSLRGRGPRRAAPPLRLLPQHRRLPAARAASPPDTRPFSLQRSRLPSWGSSPMWARRRWRRSLAAPLLLLIGPGKLPFGGGGGAAWRFLGAGGLGGACQRPPRATRGERHGTRMPSPPCQLFHCLYLLWIPRLQ